MSFTEKQYSLPMDKMYFLSALKRCGYVLQPHYVYQARNGCSTTPDFTLFFIHPAKVVVNVTVNVLYGNTLDTPTKIHFCTENEKFADYCYDLGCSIGNYDGISIIDLSFDRRSQSKILYVIENAPKFASAKKWMDTPSQPFIWPYPNTNGLHDVFDPYDNAIFRNMIKVLDDTVGEDKRRNYMEKYNLYCLSGSRYGLIYKIVDPEHFVWMAPDQRMYKLLKHQDEEMMREIVDDKNRTFEKMMKLMDNYIVTELPFVVPGFTD